MIVNILAIWLMCHLMSEALWGRKRYYRGRHNGKSYHGWYRRK